MDNIPTPTGELSDVGETIHRLHREETLLKNKRIELKRALFENRLQLADNEDAMFEARVDLETRLRKVMPNANA